MTNEQGKYRFLDWVDRDWSRMTIGQLKHEVPTYGRWSRRSGTHGTAFGIVDDGKVSFSFGGKSVLYPLWVLIEAFASSPDDLVSTVFDNVLRESGYFKEEKRLTPEFVEAAEIEAQTPINSVTVTPHEWIELGKLYESLWVIRRTANETQLGRWLPEQHHQDTLDLIAKNAQGLIDAAMHRYDLLHGKKTKDQ